jgi:membrane-associated HD superfamily phosphohydrolase
MVRAFYNKAQKITEGVLNPDQFRYEGPRPTSKIAAIIMICDACEAIVRAVGAKTKEEYFRLVDGVVKERLDDGQVDNCNITIADLTKIKQTVISVLGGIHHARVDYNKQ